MMTKILQFALLLTLVAWTTNPVNAQKKFKEGVVTLTVQDMGTDNPQMAMMKGSTMTFYFSGPNTRVDMNMMSGMMRVNAVSNNDDETKNFVLMDMMGMKYYITEIAPEEMGTTNSMASLDNLDDIKYDKNDRKEILGYDCYKATATNDQGQTSVYYITEKIKPPKPVNESANALAGFPLRMEIDLGLGDGTNLVFTATDIKSKVDPAAFTPPADLKGYQKVTMEEFLKQMDSMGN